jgi:hypothetical protein
LAAQQVGSIADAEGGGRLNFRDGRTTTMVISKATAFQSSLLNGLTKRVADAYRESLRLVLGSEVYVKPAFRITRRTLRFCYRATSAVLLAYCVGNTFFSVVGFAASVDGSSMRPTLNDPNDSLYSRFTSLKCIRLNVDWVFINCWAVRNYELSRGEVVVFVSPKGLFLSHFKLL